MQETKTKIPDEFSHRVCKTRLSPLFVSSSSSYAAKKYSEIQKLYPGVEIDIVYENLSPIVALVFESKEDCLAFTLKYGTNYGV